MHWQCREHQLSIGGQPLIMGILNITPDSFSDGGRYLSIDAALAKGRPFAAGLDVFESEPLESGHPLRIAPNALLTSHTAWFSADSVGELQRLAAEEASRRLRGEDFKNTVSIT